jgi:hypothetical protein
MHQLLFQWHLAMSKTRVRMAKRIGRRHALAAPRGSAKTTVASLLLVLHDILYSREHYVLILSATERQAQQRLAEIRRELLHGPARHWHGAPLDINTHQLQIGTTLIQAAGAGSELRGLNHHGWRPTKIILDDAESSRAANSPTHRLRLLDWHAQVVEYLGDTYTNHLAIGTILHRQSLLATLINRPDYQGHTARSILRHPDVTQPLWDQWRAILLDPTRPDPRAEARAHFLAHRQAMERGAEVLWPEREDYEELMAQLTIGGRRAFQQEKQNNPIGPDDALFDPSVILRANREGDRLHIHTGCERATHLRTLPIHGTEKRAAYLDAALGKNNRQGDFAALAVVLQLHDGTLLLERLEARRLPPTAQIHRLFDLHAQNTIHRLAIEATGFQELLLLPFDEERRRRAQNALPADLNAEPHHPRHSKFNRIAALEPLLANGTLIAASDGLDPEFWDELHHWPRSTHDDALDAVAGAVSLFHQDAQKTKIRFDSYEHQSRIPSGF